MSDGKDAGADSSANRPSLRRLTAAFLGLLEGHVELFGIELQEQKGHLLKLLLLAGFCLGFGMLLLVGLSSLVMVIFWDTYRLQAAIGLCLFHGLGCVICIWRLRAMSDDESSPFSATLEELARDRERLLP
ncbi:hypothetical protein D3C76_649140 [compost metagenome]